ncbi:serine hydrolase domain-containing protein [Hymenobacter sp. B81]|uniref:serine hydrolase domain-containing protein n=1 Tax=Hymenobacter sp. B81 TaxID=3344878 RepID=UPI0037DD7C15
MKHLLLILLLTAALSARAQSSALYFPPLTGGTWAGTSPQSLGWCQPRLDSLLNFLGRKHTKSFIILKDGRLVVEQYYGTFTRDSLWYWASAGKSLTAALVGTAQQDGLLSPEDSVTRWLGRGWTATAPAREDRIRVRHLLSMTSGLDDTPPPPCDNESTAPGCLIYRVDAGTRWAYHTGAYRRLHEVLSAASGQGINAYTNQRLGSRIGLGGAWVGGVYYSRARDMARFGLLMLARGQWGATAVLRDSAYFRRMTTPAQSFNRSYGYLWWLNGQPSYMLPGVPLPLTGPLVPTAPADMIAALGKNDQKIYVVPSLGLVVVRQGQSAGTPRLAASSFDAELWQYLSAVLNCGVTASANPGPRVDFEVYPTPATDELWVKLPGNVPPGSSLSLVDLLGRARLPHPADAPHLRLPLRGLATGAYVLQLRAADGRLLGSRRVWKQ